MVDRLKEILQRVLEWWNKFTAKQKTIIISVAAGVILALAILATILTRPKYETLITCESAKEASEITELLEGEAIPYITTDDGLIISVQKQDIAGTTYTSPKNLTPGVTYKVAIAARVNGRWDTANAIKYAGTVTIK